MAPAPQTEPIVTDCDRMSFEVDENSELIGCGSVAVCVLVEAACVLMAVAAVDTEAEGVTEDDERSVRVSTEVLIMDVGVVARVATTETIEALVGVVMSVGLPVASGCVVAETSGRVVVSGDVVTKVGFTKEGVAETSGRVG